MGELPTLFGIFHFGVKRAVYEALLQPRLFPEPLLERLRDSVVDPGHRDKDGGSGDETIVLDLELIPARHAEFSQRYTQKPPQVNITAEASRSSRCGSGR